MANFAFVVEGEVFHTAYMDENHETALKWAHALRSDPIFVNIDDYPFVGVWWKFKDGKFYEPLDLEYTIEHEKQIKDPSNKNLRFAGIIDNEVFGLMSFESEYFSDEFLNMINAAMQSNFKIIEYSRNDEVKIGYKLDGENFVK
jgi:hypothetical protein